MRILFIFFFSTLITTTFGQNGPQEDPSVKLIRVKSVRTFVDSIRKKVLLDTINFKKSDVAYTAANGYKNLNSYSPLFFINILYQYKLDIVSGNDVVAFINEILISDKIESITLLEEPKSIEIFGQSGKNGVIMIQLKDINKVNLSVAGFKFIKTVGDNFHQSIN